VQQTSRYVMLPHFYNFCFTSLRLGLQFKNVPRPNVPAVKRRITKNVTIYKTFSANATTDHQRSPSNVIYDGDAV
jgi:hypothetical protein